MRVRGACGFMLERLAMNRRIAIAAVLCLHAGLAFSQATPPLEVAPTGLEDTFRLSAQEQRAQIETLKGELQDAEARSQQFHEYLRRMQSDAVAQKALIALGRMRPYEVSRAERNWESWRGVATVRLQEAKALVASVTARRHEREERAQLFADEAVADLPSDSSQAYQEAKAAEKQVLVLLGRLEGIGEASQLDAQAAVALCDDILAQLARSVEHMRERFYWERAGLGAVRTAGEDLRKDLAAMSGPVSELFLAQNWRGTLAEALKANAQEILFGALLLALSIWRVRRLTGRLQRALAESSSFSARLAVVVLVTLRRIAPFGISWAVCLISVTAVGAAAPNWLQLLLLFLRNLFVWRLIVNFARVAFNPEDARLRLFALTPEQCALVRRRLELFGGWLFVGLYLSELVGYLGLVSAPLMLALLVVQLFALRFLDTSLAPERVEGVGFPENWKRNLGHWQGLVRTVIVLSIVTAGFGFIDLAWVAAWAAFKLSALTLVALLVWRAGVRAVDSWLAPFDTRGGPQVQRLWATVVVVVALLLAPSVAGIHPFVLKWGRELMEYGIPIGERTITLGSMLAAALCVFSAWAIGRLINAFLTHRIFPHSAVDVGMREAITATIGYLLLVGGVLLAIVQLGFDITSLAIVAGALSVGVGFGMQTLVSNFVSGLIILYERPFRLGDILEHQGVMGSVKRIRTRSTIMQTFDESELVLPNSELLTKQITNWTLSNYRARATISIGVAYGSNVELVRETLVETAAAHPRMIEEPQVFFTRFGDSSLDFQLMIWVDIRERMQVVSDVLFAIDKAFREKGIEIPFPQRVLHVRPQAGE